MVRKMVEHISESTGWERLLLALKRLASAVQLPPWPPNILKSIAYFLLLIHHIYSKFDTSIIFDVRNLLF